MLTICDRIWENQACSEFYEILVGCIFDTSKSQNDRTLRLGARALCLDCATPTMNEKLQSEGVAMHAYSVSVYYA